MTDEVGALLDRFETADRQAAGALVEDLISDGLSLEEIADVLLPRLLREVGERWESGRWTVAQEHLASDAADRALTRLAERTTPTTTVRRTLLVACAEGEWHTLAARVVGLCFQSAGWQVRLLGASVPAGQLVAAIYDTGPDLVAISCSLPANLPGAHRMIMAARETGTPVVVGGRAFGSDDRLARRLGAHGWAVSAMQLLSLAEEPEDLLNGPTVEVGPAAADLAAIEAAEDDIVRRLSRELGMHYAEDGELASGGVWLLRTLKSALLCNEPTMLTEQLSWQDRRAALGHALGSTVLGEALAAALPEGAPTARWWLEQAVRDVGGQEDS